MSHTCGGSAEAGGPNALKRIGLVVGFVLAGLALLSVSASSAIAKEQVGFQLVGEASEEASEQPRFAADSYPAYLAGKGGTYEYGFTIGTLSCDGNYSALYENHLEEATPSLALDPFYEFWGCERPSGGQGITIEANGCRHVLTLHNEGPPYVGDFGIECPSESPYRFNIGGCTVSIPPQSGRAEVSFANTGEGSSAGVELTLNVSGLEYSYTSGFCVLLGIEHEDGTLAGTEVLEAFDEP